MVAIVHWSAFLCMLHLLPVKPWPVGAYILETLVQQHPKLWPYMHGHCCLCLCILYLPINMRLSCHGSMTHYDLGSPWSVAQLLKKETITFVWGGRAWLLFHNLIFLIWHRSKKAERSTGPPDRMSHRKWRESKQQLILKPALALFGCCLVDLHFLCDILSGGPVKLHFAILLTSIRYSCHYRMWSQVPMTK